jgi:prepilin-type N-terminal cleavage/methylation domain-containing protein
MKNKRQGFTLIELLIVVAIIAILAAIAVPNFLEAQVRSKISRCHSDMRSLATAIESYTVDYNRPPFGWDEHAWCTKLASVFPGWDVVIREGWMYSRFTTPVAYITSVPNDPFRQFGKMKWQSDPGPGGTQIDEPTSHYRYETFIWYADSGAPAFVVDAFRAAYTWSLESPGPHQMFYQNRVSEMLAYNLVNFAYDATNGTKSIGMIIRTNKGVFPGK